MLAASPPVPGPLTPAAILAIQRSAGNRETTKMVTALAEPKDDGARRKPAPLWTQTAAGWKLASTSERWLREHFPDTDALEELWDETSRDRADWMSASWAALDAHDKRLAKVSAPRPSRWRP